MHRILNLGSGDDYRPSSDTAIWVNVDISPNVKTDMIMDGFKLPYPFEDEYFDGVLAQDFLEHIPHTLFDSDGKPLAQDGFLLIMNEIWRILRPNGILEARFPHPMSPNAFIDPTHTRLLFPETFLWYLCKDQSFSFYTERHWKDLTCVEKENGNLGIVMFKEA